MKSGVIDSIVFVINAIYTFTFANSCFLLLQDPSLGSFSLANVKLNFEAVTCGLILITLTSRYFFGNNIFINDVFGDQKKNALVRLFHFSTVALQGAILLLASFEVRHTENFLLMVSALFFLEFFWFTACHWLDADCVSQASKRENYLSWGFQLYGVIIALILIYVSNQGIAISSWHITLVFFLFTVETVVDFRENLSKYMGL